MGTLPILVLAATCCLQALVLGIGVIFVQSAADRAARGAPKAQVVASIPSGWRSRVRVTKSSERVQVELQPPALLPGTSRWLTVRATSEVAS